MLAQYLTEVRSVREPREVSEPQVLDYPEEQGGRSDPLLFKVKRLHAGRSTSGWSTPGRRRSPGPDPHPP